ncbi:MAG: VTT domain-containing protein [Alphaproteobacteria bacterium]|nr:VTT domain-containing protein [Alphaproteobacteria bacterium]
MRTLVLLFVACALSGIAIPMPEDLPLLAAGATLTEPGALLGLAVAGGLGVLCRDAVFFLVGRFAGERALRWRWVVWMLGEGRLARARDLVERRGGRAVLIARFLVGFRSAAFLVAGAMGVRPRDFVVWDLVGITASVPLLLGLGAVVGAPVTSAIGWLLEHRLLVVAMAALVGLAWATSAQASAHEAENPA